MKSFNFLEYAVAISRQITEGIRDRERSIIMTVLKQVATVRDNTYELQRHIWNDVQEDWPFYTDQERAILKRRKPQNLTPPASDGGSSGTYLLPLLTRNVMSRVIKKLFSGNGILFVYYIYRQRTFAQLRSRGFAAGDHGATGQLAGQQETGILSG